MDDILLTRVYESFVEKYVKKPLADADIKRQSRLLSILEEERRLDSGNWIVKSLRRITNAEIEEDVPLLLDIKELWPLLDEMYKDYPDRTRKSKVKRKFKMHSLSYEKALSNGDDLKLLEILQ